MRRVFTGITAAALIFSGSVAATNAATDIDIHVSPAYAPVGPVSPSWDAYVGKALGAIPLGVNAVGSRSHDPSAYQKVTTPISPLDMVYTGGRGTSSTWFNSWNATAAGSSVFSGLPAAFQDEYGNRIHFGVHIESFGGFDFTLQDLSWKLDSNDSTNYFDQEGDFSAANYSSTRVGIHFGADGAPGGGDDIVYDSGESGALAVNELIYVGVGDGFFSSEPGISGQADIDATLSDLLAGCLGKEDCSFDLEGIYRLKLDEVTTPLIGTSSVRIDLKPAFGGDLNHNGRIDSHDKDILTNALAGGGAYNILYDVNGNGSLEFDDLDKLVHDIAGTTFGDANCDGVFNSSDLVKVFVGGKYDTGSSAVWSTGDFNADGLFDSGDLVLAFTDGGYVAAATAAVPEPSSIMLALMGLAGLAMRRRS